MMFLNASYHGACPVPFYDASLFPLEGGYIGGRLCSSQTALEGAPSCCLPCPVTDWTYPDTFKTYNTVAAWLNVVGFILLIFLLISYALLPVSKTRSHYLSTSLIVSILFINLGFIVPLGAQPEQCYDEITPHDMYSSTTCAFSGAFIIAGGICGAVWIFVRALSMHLQICWDIVPGQRFFLLSQALGWGVPAAIFAATITVTGVSYRFGSSCHVNHKMSMQSFWGWLLSIAAASVILQLSTFGYCARVFVSNLWADDAPSSVSGNTLPRYAASVRTQAARAIWRRLKSVLFLQWRGILIVTITLVDVIFFAVVFVYLDDLESSLVTNHTRARPWIVCLIMSGGDKAQCFPQSERWLVKESVVGSVLVILSLIGLEVFCLLFRWSFISGWKEFVSKKITHKQEFVSLDALAPPHARPDSSNGARQYGANGVAFEMQSPKEFAYDMDTKIISPVVTAFTVSPQLGSSPDQSPQQQYPAHSPQSGYKSNDNNKNSDQNNSNTTTSRIRPLSPRNNQTYRDGHSERRSSLSSQGKPSFCSSRVPSHGSNGTTQSMGWDPTSSYAAAGSGLSSPMTPFQLRHGGDGDSDLAPGRAF